MIKGWHRVDLQVDCTEHEIFDRLIVQLLKIRWKKKQLFVVLHLDCTLNQELVVYYPQQRYLKNFKELFYSALVDKGSDTVTVVPTLTSLSI